MTTIAYKDGVMAADTRVMVGGTRYRPGTHIDKVYFTAGGLIGMAGDADEQYLTLEFFDTIKDLQGLSEAMNYLAKNNCDISCITVFKADPAVVSICGTYKESEDDDEYKSQVYSLELDEGSGVACGSGGKYAEMAMRMGDSAAGSVFKAMDFDPATGGDVREYLLE